MNTQFSARFLIAHRACMSAGEVKKLSFYPADLTSPVILSDILNSELPIEHQLHFLVYHCLDKQELNQLIGLFILTAANWGRFDHATHYQMIGLMLEDNKANAVYEVVRTASISESLNTLIYTYISYFLQGDNFRTSAVAIVTNCWNAVGNTEGALILYNAILIIANTYKIPNFKKLVAFS